MRLLIYLALIGLSSQQQPPPETPFYRTIFYYPPSTQVTTHHPNKSFRATESYRLSNDVTPEHYNLYITTTFSPTFDFTGQVQITITTKSPDVKSFRFHAATKLVVLSTRLIDSKGKDVSITLTPNPEKEWVEVKTGKNLVSGEKYTLGVEFKGNLTIPGYFKSSYLVGKETKWASSTHFEPTRARSAFPCFDEPNLKATFNISLNHDAQHKAFANTPINDVTITQDNRRITRFKQTPKMSTYLIAYALADYDTTVKQDRTRILARSDIKDTLDYALKTGDKILGTFEKLFDVKYPIEKMDHIAITQGMNGAMENWGLITYSEEALQYESFQSMATKKGVATILAHELAHQWFGDIVTMDWWDDIWLNEGFATYFSYRILNDVDPTWNPMELFALHVAQGIIEYDSSTYNRALDKAAESPNEISSLFDNIAYSKGGSLLYMFENLYGTKAFIEGLSSYLKTHSYENVKTDDLWTALQSSVDKNKVDLQGQKVRDIGKSWSQAGCPVVNVDYNITTNSATFSQKRWLYVDDKWQSDKTLWLIPINVIHPGVQNPKKTSLDFWLSTATTNKKDLVKEGSKWIVVNNNQTGFYRVNYTLSNWEALVEYITKTEKPILTDLTISKIMDDAVAFAKKNSLSFKIPLGLTRYLKRQAGYTPWFKGYELFEFIRKKIHMSPSFSKLKKYVANLLTVGYKSTPLLSGVDLKSNTEKYKKELLLDLAVKTENAELSADAEKLFDACYKGDLSKTLSYLERYVIYCANARMNSTRAEIIFATYKALGAIGLQNGPEGLDSYQGATCATDSKFLTKFLDYTLEDNLHKEHKKDALRYLTENNGEFMFDQLCTNYQKFNKSFSDEDELKQVIYRITEQLATDKQLQQLTDLSKQPYVPKNFFDNIIDSSADNVLWNKNNKEIHDWIAQEHIDDPPVTTTTPTTTSTPSTTSSTSTTPYTTTLEPVPSPTTKKPGSAAAIAVNVIAILGLFIAVIFLS